MEKLVKLCLLICVFVAQSAFAKIESSLEEGMVNPGYEEQPAWFKKSFLHLDEDIDEANKSGKRLMVLFYQDGCPYCKKLLQDNFGQREIADKTIKNFDVVALNLWGDREVSFKGVELSEKDFSAQLKVMYTPTLLFFDEQGKIVLRANGYYYPEKFDAALEYVIQHQDKKQSFSSYLSSISPTKTKGIIYKALETLKSPYDFSQSTDKYRLVMFEQKQCKECEELHNDILKRKESLKLLEKFDVAVVDMWSEEKVILADGKPTTIREWAKNLGIQYAPSLVYFDTQGKEVFRSDAYLKAFHIQSVMDYVSSEAYKDQPNFQRYIDNRAHLLREQGINVDLMR